MSDRAPLSISRMDPGRIDEIVELSVRAWSPVFPKMRKEIDGFVYDSFYPHGWEARQSEAERLEAEVDRILQKVREQGTASLSYVELETLKRAT
ncbi:MAG TPA: hypothetical protein PKH09_14080, partial [Parvularculaceae bacterium]|nr:hypothetical protein [Parvularculaceae bacterium]